MMRILIVDDDPDVRHLLTAGLAPMGHELLTVADGEEAMDLAGKLSPDLVVTDLMLPGMDGLEITRRVKELAGPGTFLPVILITALDQVDERVRSFAAGCDDYLAKPVSLLELRARVGSLLARRGQYLELCRANHALREAHRMKEELAAMVVHDLRNPLAALRGNLEFADSELKTADPVVRESLSDCRNLVGRALSLVGGLLDVAQLEEGLLRARTKDIDVGEFLTGCSRFHSSDLRARKLALETHVEPAGLRATLDPNLLGRAIENLLDNAVRYAPSSGRVSLRAWIDGDELVITVGNNGPAIPPADRGRLFDKFFRIEERRAGARAAKGLGLYFCKLAVDTHKGRISIEETVDLPTVFMVRLPRTPPPVG